MYDRMPWRWEWGTGGPHITESESVLGNTQSIWCVNLKSIWKISEVKKELLGEFKESRLQRIQGIGSRAMLKRAVRHKVFIIVGQ